MGLIPSTTRNQAFSEFGLWGISWNISSMDSKWQLSVAFCVCCLILPRFSRLLAFISEQCHAFKSQWFSCWFCTAQFNPTTFVCLPTTTREAESKPFFQLTWQFYSESLFYVINSFVCWTIPETGWAKFLSSWSLFMGGTPPFPIALFIGITSNSFFFPDNLRLCLYWLIRCCCDKISWQEAWKEGLIFGLWFKEVGIDHGAEGMAVVRKAWWHHLEAGWSRCHPPTGSTERNGEQGKSINPPRLLPKTCFLQQGSPPKESYFFN